MKKIVGENISWNETVEIHLSLNGVTGEKKERHYYFVDNYKYKETKFNVKSFIYTLIRLDGSGRKREVDSRIFEDEFKKGNIKIESENVTEELTL